MQRAILSFFLLLLAACSSDKTSEQKKAPPPPQEPPAVYSVKFETTKGDFVIQVHQDWAPNGADHFFELVNTKFYDGVRFHRVVRGFICQFGISGRPTIQQIWGTAKIPDDPVKQSNKKGFVSYAKLGPDSRTTQVFINLKDNSGLDKDGFAPFGQVVEGMDIVERLYLSYGEVAPNGNGPDPTQIELQGETYLENKFPRLDTILHATVLQP